MSADFRRIETKRHNIFRLVLPCWLLTEQTTGAAADDAVGVAAEVAVAAAAEDDAAPAQDAESMQIDSWESVSQQPSWYVSRPRPLPEEGRNVGGRRTKVGGFVVS